MPSTVTLKLRKSFEPVVELTGFFGASGCVVGRIEVEDDALAGKTFSVKTFSPR